MERAHRGLEGRLTRDGAQGTLRLPESEFGGMGLTAPIASSGIVGWSSKRRPRLDSVWARVAPPATALPPHTKCNATKRSRYISGDISLVGGDGIEPPTSSMSS